MIRDMDLKLIEALQRALSSSVILKSALSGIRLVAGADFAYDPQEREIGAAIAVQSFPSLETIEVSQAVRRVEFPYVPGFLSLREGPAFFEAYEKLRRAPDVTLLDGNGIAHPRWMGLASYVGVVLDIATIGCAKSATFPFTPPSKVRGSFSVYRNTEVQQVGYCLRTSTGVKPVFVSPGHRVDFEDAKRLVLACAKFRIPEPLREAHRQANEIFKTKNPVRSKG
jgi:deoxyribonuclease V